MPIITLISDLGNKDFYLSSVKGKIYGQLENIQIVDINNNVDQFNIAQAAFVLQNVFNDFPKDTIHLVGVGSGSVDQFPHLGIRYKNQYIIAPDNGFFSLIAEQKPDLMVELTQKLDTDQLTFPLRDVYAPAACHLARGGTLEVIGRRVESFERRTLMQPILNQEYIRGMVVYVDSYGNALTNITRDMLKAQARDRSFMIGFREADYGIETISKRYSDVSEGDRLALFNTAGYLEIALNQGHASNLLGLKIGELIIIEFYDH